MVSVDINDRPAAPRAASIPSSAELSCVQSSPTASVPSAWRRPLGNWRTAHVAGRFQTWRLWLGLGIDGLALEPFSWQGLPTSNWPPNDREQPADQLADSLAHGCSTPLLQLDNSHRQNHRHVYSWRCVHPSGGDAPYGDPGARAWAQVGDNEYDITYMTVQLDDAGNFIGNRKTYLRATMAPSGMRFTARVRTKTIDAQGVESELGAETMNGGVRLPAGPYPDAG